MAKADSVVARYPRAKAPGQFIWLKPDLLLTFYPGQKRRAIQIDKAARAIHMIEAAVIDTTPVGHRAERIEPELKTRLSFQTASCDQ